MKFTKTDYFFFFFALFLSGVGMLQPINSIFGYTLVIIGIVGMAGVLIRAVRRKQNNASYSSIFQILSFTRDVFRLSSVGRTQFRNNNMIGETKVNFSRASPSP